MKEEKSMSTPSELLKNVSGLLLEKNLHIATAESCTGGLLAHTLTNIAGSSSYFERGVITYSNQAKMDLLRVPKPILDSVGAVSAEVAKAMAKGIRENAGVDIGLATTGIAGPGGGSKEKPVGLVFIGCASSRGTSVKKYQFQGKRVEIKQATCFEALQMLLECLS